MRVDKLLLSQNKFSSRAKAQEAISQGKVFLADGKPVKKSSLDLPDDTAFTIKNHDNYVSRGAYKLLKAIEVFHLDFTDKMVLDIGASTGGFTQVALNAGAKKVYALDVGSGQLNTTLVEDPRVIVIENYNFRYAKENDFPPEKFDLIQCDVSFISLKHIIPPASTLLKPNGKAVFLIKPQFEAGKEYIRKHGLVKDSAVHLAVLQQVLGYFVEMVLKLRACPTHQ